MADTYTDAENDAANASGGSMVSFIVAIAILTLMSAVAGFATGGFLIETPAPEAKADKAANAKKTGSAKPGVQGKQTSDDHAKPAGDEGLESAYAIEIIDLKPIVAHATNVDPVERVSACRAHRLHVSAVGRIRSARRR